MEGATALSQGDEGFNREDDEFEEARVEENAFDAACAEESAARAQLQRARNMAGYATVKANIPKEDKEE